MKWCWLNKHKFKIISAQQGYTCRLYPKEIVPNYEPGWNAPSTLIVYRCQNKNCDKIETKIIPGHLSNYELGIDSVKKLEDWDLRNLTK